MFRQVAQCFARLRFVFILLFISIVMISLTFTPSGYQTALAVDVPTLISPAYGAEITATGFAGSLTYPPVALPEFQWTSVIGATSYRLQISQDIAFTTKQEFTTPYTHYTPITLSSFSDGDWFWRVRVEGPVASNYSDIFQFRKTWASVDSYPVLIAPADGSQTDFYNAPTFSWQPVIGAAQYRFQISPSSDFSSLTVNQLTLHTSFQPNTKLATGSFYWRVIPIDPALREGTYSAVWSFTQSYPFIPQLIEPGNNSHPTFTPSFRWTAVVGAQFYRLQYSTDPSFNSGVTTVDSRNTTYTPTSNLSNDVNYFWRVRAHSGNSISNWSSVWSFLKQWYVQPLLLTPTNNYQQARFPFFSWTPVPGASYYKIEINCLNSFPPTTCPAGKNKVTATTANTFYTPDQTYFGTEQLNYWRVTPYDHNNNAGKPSNVSSYWSSSQYNSPLQVYPFFYYLPNSFPPPNQAVYMNPYEDRTAPLPVFMWNKMTVPAPTGGTLSTAYRIQVSTDPLFNTVNWTQDTQNLVATPTKANPFTPSIGVDYYWRICPLDTIGGNCLSQSVSASWWSQVWQTRINLSSGLTPTSGTMPQLIRPETGSEIVETTPLLEWWPMSGAQEYEVAISLDPSFASLADSAIVPYPAYAPTISLAERAAGRLDYGTYFWRVRARNNNAPLGNWSPAWRFQLASQSEWKRDRTVGDASNRLAVAVDPDDTVDNRFELKQLYASQSSDYWYFGFDVTSTGGDLAFGLYLDQDHRDGSGATTDPRGYTVSTASYHMPEFAIYINEIAGSFSTNQVSIYAWNGTSWGIPSNLLTIGGDLYYSSGYLEIKVPNTAIGMQQETGSYALSLLSFPAGSGQPVDSTPADPTIPGSGPVSRFASVSERLNLRTPLNKSSDPSTIPSILPMFWDYPTGSMPSSPWAGVEAKIYLDPQYTTEVANLIIASTAPYYSPTFHAWADDFDGDNTYYWRVRPRYLDSVGPYFGAWSQGSSFERKGFVPQNLLESVTFATPTFVWDIVEGATQYDIQVDNDPNFGSTAISTATTQNSYTPINTLANGVYYWRVRARRYGSIVNEWSPTKSFTLTLPQPTNLRPDDPNVNNPYHYAPTLCWDTLVKDANGYSVLAAYKYRVQVSKADPTFSVIFDTVDTEQSCWTPTKGYPDSQKYYWRVAMIDGDLKVGDFSPAAEFTKQYPFTTLISPINNKFTDPPTFVWIAVTGAAKYKLEVSLYDTFTPLYDSVLTNSIRYTPTKLYDTTKLYYWRVAILDQNGNQGPFTGSTVISGFKALLPIVKQKHN